jgi:hypothetical protein
MPLYWTIDSKARLFTGVAEGNVSLNDAIDLLDAMAGAKAMTYRKLFDGRAATPTMSADELLSLCARIRSYHDQGMMGALALVATSEQTVVFARLLGALASAKRPIKVFENPRQARNWIELLA